MGFIRNDVSGGSGSVESRTLPVAILSRGGDDHRRSGDAGESIVDQLGPSPNVDSAGRPCNEAQVTAARSKSSKWSAGRILSGPVSIVYIGFGGTTGYFGRLQATKRMR